MSALDPIEQQVGGRPYSATSPGFYVSPNPFVLYGRVTSMDTHHAPDDTLDICKRSHLDSAMKTSIAVAVRNYVEEEEVSSQLARAARSSC